MSTQRTRITRWPPHVRDRHADKITTYGWSTRAGPGKSVAGEGARADTVRAIATRPLEVRPMLVVRTWVLPSLSRSGD